MEDNKIRVGITQGDINGVGYEVILKTFADPVMLELCTPIIYGSPKVAAYHRKSLDLPTNFSIVNSASEAVPNRLSVVNCTDDEVKVEFSKPDPEAGKAALGALERAIEDYREGLIDVIVTAPINKHTIQSEEFSFPGHTEYIEERLGNGNKSLMILMKNDFRVALVTTHIPVREIATTITKELIQEKLMIFHHCLKQDFGIGAPRIAVLSLNPHAGDGGLLTTMAFAQIPIVGPGILVIGIITFAFSTILGWAYYGECCARYLTGRHGLIFYRALYILTAAAAPVIQLNLVWMTADVLNALMVLPNLVSLLCMSDVIVRETRKYLE